MQGFCVAWDTENQLWSGAGSKPSGSSPGEPLTELFCNPYQAESRTRKRIKRYLRNLRDWLEALVILLAMLPVIGVPRPWMPV